MLFNNIKVSAMLLKSGGLEDALQEKTDTQIENFQRSECLEMIKNDLKVELGTSEIDFDLVATNYDYLLIEALRNLQRYQILLIFGDVSMDGGNAKSMSELHIKNYELIKKKFSSIKVDSKEKIASSMITNVYL